MRVAICPTRRATDSMFCVCLSEADTHLNASIPSSIRHSVHYEGELGVVIGARAAPARAGQGRATCSARTATGPAAKDSKTFCPVGPWIVRSDEVVFEDLRVRTLLD